MSDGIEIHFDRKSGRLELACEPDTFAAFREAAKSELGELPDIQLDEVVEIHVTDSAAYFAKNHKYQSKFRTLILGAAMLLVGSLAVVGACDVIRRVAD